MNSRIIRRQAVDSEALMASNIHPMLKRLYANRQVSRPEQVEYSLERLLDFSTLKGIAAAAKIVAEAVQQQQKVVIVGDYDTDGATSSALVMRAMKAFGLASINYLVPNRFEYGYGLTPEIVAVTEAFSPQLIITVDNGISSIDGVAAAQARGIKVVITDHHLAGHALPAADAIVNPNQPGCEFASKCIAGVGVAFYLMLAVRAELRQAGWFDSDRSDNSRPEPNMAELLDLVALGTVADVVPLDENNRLLVERGLARIRSGRCSHGIRALLQIAGKDVARCTSQDFGFVIGPRLNAAGRLDDMSAGIECLLAPSMQVAQQHAELLNDLNQQRKQIQNDMLEQAMSTVEVQLSKMQGQPLEAGLCLYDNDWHQGVVGLVASRIKEQFHRPVIAFADADTDAGSVDSVREIKGSARSIPGLHIRDVLDAVATRHPGLVEKFGGHAMAAGLSLQFDKLEAFKQAFVEEVERSLPDGALDKTIETDGPIASNEMNLESAELLRYAGPWGQHFPEPAFDDEFDVINWRIVGEKHLKLQLLHKSSGHEVDAIAFNTTEEALADNGGSLRAVYRLDVNEFRGRKSLQLIVEHIEAG